MQWPGKIVDRVAFTGFSVVMLSALWALSSIKDLWTDELLTLRLSAKPDLLALWRAIPSSGDATPPLFIALTFLCVKLFGAGEIVLRLPSVLAYWVACAVIFFVLLKKLGRPAAWFGLLIWLAQFRFAVEARSYAVLLALSALSYVFWDAARQRRARRYTVPAFALCLIGVLSTHYYGCLVLLPFAAGEVSRSLGKRRLADPATSAIICLAPLTYLLYSSMIRAVSAFSTGFWAAPRDWSQVLWTYQFLLGTGGVALLFGGSLLLGLVLQPLAPRSAGIDRDDVVVFLGFAALPIAAYILAQLTNAFVSRYTLPAILGLAVLAAIGAKRFCGEDGRRWGVALSVIIVILALDVRLAYKTWSHERLVLREAMNAVEREASAGREVVLADHNFRKKLAHYLRPELAKSLRMLMPNDLLVYPANEDFLYLGIPPAESKNLQPLRQIDKTFGLYQVFRADR